MEQHKVYDLVIIGGGSGGLSAMGVAIEMGASVALIEKHRLGGDCTWSGCVPSKSLLKAAKVAHHMRSAELYGIEAAEPVVNMKKVMGHVDDIVQETYHEESPEALRAKGVDVYLGEAHFIDAHTLAAGEQILGARNVIIATGAHPWAPPIDGLDSVDYLTYEDVWHMDTLPEHLIVIGGGPIGSEMSQAFNRLGSRVCQIEAYDRLLSRDDPVASRIIMDVFRKEGVNVHNNSKAEKVWHDEAGYHVLTGGDEIVGDALLVAVGRRANVNGMDLENAGVNYDARGIKVDDKLRTSTPHIFAIGDCIGSYQFTHYAGWQAAIAVRNALLPGNSKGVRATVPWTTFTDPEVAHVGMTDAMAREQYGDSVGTLEFPLSAVDRARAEVDTDGVIFIVHKRARVLGVTIVAERAGELIHEWLYVVQKQLSLQAVVGAIHTYPSYSVASTQAGGALLQKVYLNGKIGKLVAKGSRVLLKLMRVQRGY